MEHDDSIAEPWERLIALDAAALCDGSLALKVQPRVPDPRDGIRLQSAGELMVGRAHPVRCDDDFLEVWMGMENAASGNVLVIEAGNRAVIGELFASEAARKGLAGIVIDGYCRDLAFLRSFELPVYARGSTPQAGPVQVATGGAAEVAIGGVKVGKGDIVFGDLDGLVFLDPDLLEDLIPAAEAVQKREAAILGTVQAGQSLFAHTNLHQHYQARLNGIESKIAFSVDPEPGRISE